MANYKKKAANAVLLADKMRKSVLQAAIEGKLTTQNPAEDGDARDLLVEIQAEKQRLITAGEIKREKALPAIDENDLPFDIPDNWVWVRLGSISEIGTGATPLSTNKSYYGGDISWMTSSDTSNDYVFKTAQKITQKALDETNCKVYPAGTLVVAMYGQGKTRGQITELAINAATNQACAAISLILKSEIAKKYIKFYFKKIYSEIRETARGGAQPNLNLSMIKNYLLPLPPLTEQQRIVEKLEQLLPQLHRLQADENKLHAMQSAFPSRMQASLLQAAIEGKLTTQDPKADGTASDLLKQIQTEKKRLIDAKEIKREKTLPAITDEEKPFDVPNNWEWVRLSQIGEIISGGTPKTTNLKYWQNGDIPWITPADMKNVSKYISKGARNITKAGLTSSSARLMPKGSVLFSSRAPIGYVAIAENEISTNQGFKSIVPFNFNLSEYLYFALMALANDIAKLGTGTTFKEVSGATVSNILIPLPPLAEQERIVAKLDALLPKVQALNDL